MTNPHLSSGVFSQRYWPEVGDVDDCWAMADIMGIHAVAPWVALPAMTAYRAAADNPDRIGATGGSIAQSAKAIRALWPELGVNIKVSEGTWSWDTFKQKMTPDRVASVSVLSSYLPPSYQYNFGGQHRVALFKGDAGWRIANPLAPPHSRWRDISEADIKKAIDAYPGQVWCVVMPTVAQAFETHPDHPGGLSQADVDAAYAKGRKDGIADAAAAAAAVK